MKIQAKRIAEIAQMLRLKQIQMKLEKFSDSRLNELEKKLKDEFKTL